MLKTTKAFTKAYKQLNTEQRLAVDTIDGPLLVLAGPGTGKTQILSARVANILQKTDVMPSNILCLTFTDSGASNMRQRLREFMGDSAYDVTISTYHSFGSDIIKSYSEYFQQIGLDRTDDVRLERPIDELTQIQLLDQIVSKLPFDSQLLSTRYYLKDVVSTLSDLKQHLITPAKLRDLASSNLSQIDAAQPILDSLINRVGGFSRKKAELGTQYATLLAGLSALKGDLIELAAGELQAAYDEYQEKSSSKPLTAWKNKWLPKNELDHFTLTTRTISEKMLELADVYQKYEQALQAGALYDFDDMILRAIDGLTQNDELRYNLQERYQYILLDEFQDTNPSQFKLVKTIADHPVHEGRPNVMAVGDDDQAIFAFQGANVGNLQDFLRSFKDVVVINLVDNYRSHRDILHVAHNIATQITTRLTAQLPDINKILRESSSSLPAKSTLVRHELSSQAGEYSWVATQIQSLIKSGVSPQEITVIAPKHAILESFVPFLKNLAIPLSYEKRENILESAIVQELRLSANLLQALSDQNIGLANEYFPRVLSLPYWNIPALDIWRVNWQLTKFGETRSWPEIALETESLAPAVNFYLTLSGKVATSPLEIVLDQLSGNQPVEHAGQELLSPLKAYYFGDHQRAHNALAYFESIAHLSVIRSHLREYQQGSDHQLRLADFLNFFIMYEAAGAVLINSHPIAQGESSVKLMTAYKAKGLEFDHVFILHAHNDIWGSDSKGSMNKLSLPPNLSPIRYSHSGDDERLRLFFVAITRARHALFISSHLAKDNGKPTTPLKYLGEMDGLSTHLPKPAQKITTSNTTLEQQAKDIATLWSANRVTLPLNFRDLLAERLESYVMSPTHLNAFLDLEYAGPETFLTNTLLRFPSAPTASSEFGVAIHNTLEWYQLQIVAGHKPVIKEVLSRYDSELARRYLTPSDHDKARDKGHTVLQLYLSARAEMFKEPAKAEVNFFSEGVVVDGARLTGKIDRLEVDHTNKTLRIVDFKTGKALPKWDSSLNAYKYRHQLYFYKFLLEGSHTWRGYKVQDARLEFIEPTGGLKTGKIAPALSIQFDSEEEQIIKKLIKVVWDKIQALDLPDTSNYPQSIQGTKAFETSLLRNN